MATNVNKDFRGGTSLTDVGAFEFVAEASSSMGGDSMFLRQSTAVTLKLGPFIDDTDFKTEETALTISQADVRLSKNGGNYAQKNDTGAATHDELGEYDVDLDATDTNTVGILIVRITETGSLPYKRTYQVVEEAVYDKMFGADAVGPPEALIRTTIATLASQTSFTLTAGSADDDAYNNGIITVIDQTTKTQLATGTVSDYTGSTKTITLNADPGVFTMAAGDIVEIQPAISTPSAASIADAVWDETIASHTTGGSFGNDLQNKATTAAVFANTMSELAQGIPPATPTLEECLMLLYMSLRNKVDVTATTLEIHNDAGTVITKKTLSDDDTTYSEAKMVSGP